MPDRPDDRLSARHVAAILGITPETVRRIDEKDLPCERTPGGHRRWIRSEVERYAGLLGRKVY